MTVQQVTFWELTAEPGDSPVLAVATDGETAVPTFSTRVDPEVVTGLTENFGIKVDLAKELADWTPIEVLSYNLPYQSSDPVEFESFEAAQAAAQEAFGE